MKKQSAKQRNIKVAMGALGLGFLAAWSCHWQLARDVDVIVALTHQLIIVLDSTATINA